MKIFILFLSWMFQMQPQPDSKPPDIPVAPLDFHISFVPKKCSHCVVISKKLTNKSTDRAALSDIGTTFTTKVIAVPKNVGLYMPSGMASIITGESLYPTKDAMLCKVLQPGESFTIETTIEISKKIKPGTPISLELSYSNFVRRQCDGVDLIYGSAKSNTLEIRYR